MFLGRAGSLLWHAGSSLQRGSVWALQLTTACWILVPKPGTELGSSALEGRFLPTGPPEKSPLLPDLSHKMVKEDQSVFLAPLWAMQLRQEHTLLNVGPSCSL